ncbi:hypothetical protein F5B21DRAFT_489777 [Xylaria acuta]|nr:hypothetical protein F5B21DRAFT_489777 [Xylaria acuta]
MVQHFAMAPYTFKDGLHVPADTVVSFPNLRHNTDTSSPLVPDASTMTPSAGCGAAPRSARASFSSPLRPRSLSS